MEVLELRKYRNIEMSEGWSCRYRHMADCVAYPAKTAGKRVYTIMIEGQRAADRIMDELVQFNQKA